MTGFLVVQFVDDSQKTVGSVIANSRKFSSGARGFGGYGKVEIDGKRYQVSLNVIEIGSAKANGANGHKTAEAESSAPDTGAILAEAEARGEAEAKRLLALAAGGKNPASVGASVKARGVKPEKGARK